MTELIGQIEAHIRQCSPHMLERETIKLLRAAALELAASEKREAELRSNIAAKDDALKAMYFAYSPEGHNSPQDCFATGPFTGNNIQDLIACPGCAADKKYKAALNLG